MRKLRDIATYSKYFRRSIIMVVSRSGDLIAAYTFLRLFLSSQSYIIIICYYAYTHLRIFDKCLKFVRTLFRKLRIENAIKRIFRVISGILCARIITLIIY